MTTAESTDSTMAETDRSDSGQLGAKAQAEFLLELWKGTTARRSERRSYEWKIAFGLWASLLLTAQLVASKGSAIASGLPSSEAGWVRWGSLLLVALIVLAHAVYLIGAALGYNQDRKTALHYEGKLAELLGASKGDEKTKCEPVTRPVLWVSLFQVLVTAGLSALVVLLVWTLVVG
jgi:hypothetical protein